MIQKEVRALLPAWAACAAALLVATNGIDALRAFAPVTYLIGTVSLGAMSIGHEYSYGTISVLLSQPISRRRLLLTKLGVLAVMLVALTALAWATVPPRPTALFFGGAFFWLPVLTSLVVTPWLTMLSRSPVAGAVFTLSITGIVLIAGEWIGIAIYGYTRQVDTFRVALLWWTMSGLCAIGAVMTWRTFATLQPLEGVGKEVDLAPRGAAAPSRLTRRSATWLLVTKELRLQQLALVVAGLYILGHVAMAFSTSATVRSGDATTIVTIIYAGLLGTLIGSMASAQERSMRTLDPQLLLPMRTAHQWRIKIGVALGLAAMLAVALPGMLIWILPPEAVRSSPITRQLLAPSFVLALAAVTVLSLYVSSLCSSGLWALMLSVPAALAVALFVGRLHRTMEGVLQSLVGTPDWRLVDRWAGFLTIAVILVVLRLALSNHRSADRSYWGTAAQVAIAAGAMTAAVAIAGLAGALSR